MTTILPRSAKSATRFLIAVIGVGGCASESSTTTSIESTSSISTSISTADRSTIEITVVLPLDDWPNPDYEGEVDVVAEAEDGQEYRPRAAEDRITIELPSEGPYRVGALIGDGECWDTAGVADAGNPPVEVRDGDTIRLRDTGEICN